MTYTFSQLQATSGKTISVPQQNIHCLPHLTVATLFFVQARVVAQHFFTRFNSNCPMIGKADSLRFEPLSIEDRSKRSLLLFASSLFVSNPVLNIIKQKLGWLLELGLARDPFLYLLLVTEVNLATCRHFLRSNEEYLQSILPEDRGHYYFWLRKGFYNPFGQLVFFPGVCPAALFSRRNKRTKDTLSKGSMIIPGQQRVGEEILRKMATVSSFLEDKEDLEFHIKWLYCEDMELSLDSVISRDDICKCRTSYTVQQDLEFFASVESTKHILETITFGLRYYLFVGYSIGVARVILTPSI